MKKLTQVMLGSVMFLALVAVEALGQVVVGQPPPPPPAPYGVPAPAPVPQVVVPVQGAYRVYYTHTLRPRRTFLYGTYPTLQAAEQAVNWLNAHPRFRAYIG